MNTATTLSTPVLAARDIRKFCGKGTARFDALAGVTCHENTTRTQELADCLGPGHRPRCTTDVNQITLATARRRASQRSMTVPFLNWRVV